MDGHRIAGGQGAGAGHHHGDAGTGDDGQAGRGGGCLRGDAQDGEPGQLGALVGACAGVV